MGFGKTLTMIALVATETPTSIEGLAIDYLGGGISESPDYTLPQTLIIVPPPCTYLPHTSRYL